MSEFPTDHPLEPYMAAWEALTSTSRTGFALGKCYENAGRFVLEKGEPTGHFDGSPLLLCHGQVRGPDGRHGHAWVEWGDGHAMVFDPSNDQPTASMILAMTYYQAGDIVPEQVKRYTADQARELVLKHETYGPWDGEP